MAGGSTDEEPQVFWGYESAVDDNGDPVLGRAGIESMKSMTEKLVKQSDAEAEFDKWNQAKVRQFIKAAIQAGLLPRDADYFQAKQLWLALVSESADKTKAGQKMSPWDVLSFIGGDPRLAQREEEPKAKTVTTVDTQVNLTDPESARAMVHEVLSSTLGRRATQEELDDFVTTLKTYEKANPAVRTTTTRYNKQGSPVRSTATVTGGGDPRAMLEEQAMETPEYASYQAAGIYFPLLMQAIGATADV